MRSPDLNNLRRKVARENNAHSNNTGNQQNVNHQEGLLASLIPVKSDVDIRRYKSRDIAYHIWACVLYYIYANEKIGTGKTHTTNLEKWSYRLGSIITITSVCLILFILGSVITDHWFFGVIASGGFLYFIFE